uniref:Legumain n=1 Tax=Angiostrongylus cantonensis TaxID=6313 RepID=A0A158P7M2_ANGCA
MKERRMSKKGNDVEQIKSLMEVLVWTFFLALLSFGKSHPHDSESVKPPQGNLYALLVAGSNGWWNYRHQADVAHAYQLLKRKGVPEDNIIVMMYDDIANDPDDSVTPENFLNVLTGNAQNVTGGTGRVINSPDMGNGNSLIHEFSTANDRIFVYFTDHGGDGIICFPDDVLSKDDMNTVLNAMYHEKRYYQLVFYLEACESGSMFDGTLQKKMNIYAMTAANPDESSWGTYCDNDMNLPCLGDLFSVNWMQDSEAFDDVRTLTNLSHVMRYGNLKITKEPVGWFEGEDQEPTTIVSPTVGKEIERQYPKVSWPARDIELMHLQRLRGISNNALISKALEQKIAKIHEDRRNIEALYKDLVANLLPYVDDRKQMLEERNAVKDLKCHNDVVKAFDTICIDVNKFDYALKYIYVLNNLCTKVGGSEKIIDAMHTTCSSAGKQYL